MLQPSRVHERASEHTTADTREREPRRGPAHTRGREEPPPVTRLAARVLRLAGNVVAPGCALVSPSGGAPRSGWCRARSHGTLESETRKSAALDRGLGGVDRERRSWLLVGDSAAAFGVHV